MGFNFARYYSFVLSLFCSIFATGTVWLFCRQNNLHFSPINLFVFLGISLFFFFCIIFVFFKIKINIQIKKSLDAAAIPTDSFPQQSEKEFNQLKEILTDFSFKKQKEIEALKKLEKYRRDFIGDVSHELKTPIFNIQGYLETILEEESFDEDFTRKYIEKANQNVKRLEEIIKDLLLISQYETGMLSLQKTSFDIVLLINQIFDSFALQAATKNIHLKFIANYQNLFVFADKLRIEQVLTNLISNAIKYSNIDGFVSIGFIENEDKLKVEVTDNGNGIAQEHLPRLFERFYRVDKSRNRNEGGTGLGLSIVKHIVEAHQEKVGVSSVVGIGTTFFFTLPKKNNEN